MKLFSLINTSNVRVYLRRILRFSLRFFSLRWLQGLIGSKTFQKRIKPEKVLSFRAFTWVKHQCLRATTGFQSRLNKISDLKRVQGCGSEDERAEVVRFSMEEIFCLVIKVSHWILYLFGILIMISNPHFSIIEETVWSIDSWTAYWTKWAPKVIIKIASKSFSKIWNK